MAQNISLWNCFIKIFSGGQSTSRIIRGAAGICAYGFVLGLSLGTRITTTTFYALSLLVTAGLSFWGAVAIMAIYGVARGVPVIVLFGMPDSDAFWMRPVASLGEVTQIVNAVTLGFVGTQMLF
jgi:hypothetical protein